MSEKYISAGNIYIWRSLQVQTVLILFLFSYIICEGEIAHKSEIKSIIGKDSSENPSFVRSEVSNRTSEITVFSTSAISSDFNAFELSLQENCNQLWSYRNKLKHETSNIVRLHREFVVFLGKNSPRVNTNALEEIFKKSLDISANDNRSKEIIQRFQEYHFLATNYQFISSDKDDSTTKILISNRSPLNQALKDLFLIRNEYLKYTRNVDICVKKKKKVIKNGLDSLSAIIFLSKFLNGLENTHIDENMEYILKWFPAPGNLDSSFSFIKILKKLQEICNHGIDKENEQTKNKQIRWLKKKSNYINKAMESLETIVKSHSKRVNNLLNCINHFQNSKSVNENTLTTVGKIGNLITDYSTNRKNILSIISSRYTIATLNTYILKNKLFSLWLFVQRRLTAVQIAIKILKESKELIDRVKQTISMEESIELLTKCSETLRRTASDWNIFFTSKNYAIIKSLHEEALKQLNHYKSEVNPNTLTMNMEWLWLNSNINGIIDQGYYTFEGIMNNNLQTPLKSCAKSLSSLYKSLKSEFIVNRELSEKSVKKINKEYRNALNDASSLLLKQMDSLSSLKHIYLWPRNNATLISALSMYNRTLELVKSINSPHTGHKDFEKSIYSYELLEHYKVITNGFSILYENLKTRFDWDFSVFLTEFGYLKDIGLGLETEETIDFSKLKIFEDQSSQFGEWFEETLEFLSLGNSNPSKVKNILEPAINFRLQFIQQWSDIISKIINKVGNPTAYSINKISEEAYNYYLQHQALISKEFSTEFENNLSIMKYVDVVDNSLSDLNKESFVSKFETVNAPNIDSSYHGDDEFSSVTSIRNYLADLKTRVDNHCNTELNRGDSEYIEVIKKICSKLPPIFSTVHQNLKRVESRLQKAYSDLDSQKTDIEKLDVIIQDCISIDDKVARVKCWIPNQSVELPLRRALQIRRVMNGWLRDIIKTKILSFSNFIEDCLKLNIKGSLVFESNSSTKDQKGNIEIIKSFQLLLKLIDDLIPNIMDELNTLETMYLKFYENKINEVAIASKMLLYNFIKLKSIKTTLIHHYGKPNIFQKIFRFPKLLLSKDEVYDIESMTFAFETPVQNNSTYAEDLTDYIKNNQILSRNHTTLLGKYLKALSTLKSRIEDIPQVISGNSTLSTDDLKAEIELEKFNRIQEKSLLILGESDKYLKLANVESFRYYTVRNITGNLADVITNLSEEIKKKGKELERREEEIASTNCFRRWLWKRRVKKRMKIKNEKIDKLIKKNKRRATSNNLKLIRKQANGKLRLFLTKTISINNTDKSYKLADDYEDVLIDDKSDLESFQFDDLYKFDEISGRFNPKNQVEQEIEYDVDTGGRTDDVKKTNPLVLKISNALDMAVSITNSIRQYREIKKSLQTNGVEFGQESSGVNLMAGVDIINAITGGPTDDLSAMLGSISDQDTVFNQGDILGELQTGGAPGQITRETDKDAFEAMGISYDDFKNQVEFELKNSDLNFDFDD
ncbi:putative signal peptide-containing protein [Cryptosporidium canis]|nr:putative signal peptide-containing protein [Cryptosporidium canis]